MNIRRKDLPYTVLSAVQQYAGVFLLADRPCSYRRVARAVYTDRFSHLSAARRVLTENKYLSFFACCFAVTFTATCQ